MIPAKRLPPISAGELKALTEELGRRTEIIRAMMLSGADRSAIADAILRFEFEMPLMDRLQDTAARINSRTPSYKH
jgi:hypothetical protein